MEETRSRNEKTRQSIWSRVGRKLGSVPPAMFVGASILIIYTVVAATAQLWAPYRYDAIGVGVPLRSTHTLCTGSAPINLAAMCSVRVVYGARYVLFVSLSGTALGLVVGAVAGLLSGYIKGWFDEIVMRISEAFISIPFIVLALVVIAAAGSNLSSNLLLLVGVVGLVYAPRIARMARTVALDLSMRDYVTAARARGESALSIALRELLPNAMGTLLVEFAVRAGYAPVLIGSLGFLGFGARPPTPEWGLMISENRSGIVSAPMTVLGPGLALAVLVVGLNLCTEGIARILGRNVQRAPI